MKKVIYTSVVCLLIVLALLAVSIIRGVNHMKWHDYTPGQLHEIAISIEIFKQSNDRYPTNLVELQSDSLQAPSQTVSNLLSGKLGTSFSYTVVSNGFTLSASMDGGFLAQSESMTETFHSEQFRPTIIKENTNPK